MHFVPAGNTLCLVGLALCNEKQTCQVNSPFVALLFQDDAEILQEVKFLGVYSTCTQQWTIVSLSFPGSSDKEALCDVAACQIKCPFHYIRLLMFCCLCCCLAGCA